MNKVYVALDIKSLDFLVYDFSVAIRNLELAQEKLLPIWKLIWGLPKLLPKELILFFKLSQTLWR